MRKRSLTPRAKQIRFLDYLWGTCIILKDGRCCIFCGRVATQAHHIFSKANGGNVRYDLRNGVATCWACHLYKPHTDPERHRQQIVACVEKRYGKGSFDLLHARAMMRGSLKMPDFKLEELYLMGELKKYTSFSRVQWDTWSYSAKMKKLKEIRRRGYGR